MFASYQPSRRVSLAPTSRRTVYNNAMVAHVWAQQSQNEGRSNNGQFYFVGSTIYSYGSHFPIARFSADKNVVWFTQHGYSKTTSGHIRYTQDALRGLPVQIIRVPDLSCFDECSISETTRAAIEETIIRKGVYEDLSESMWNAFQRIAGTPEKAWPIYADRVQYVRDKDAAREVEKIAEKISDARSVIDKHSAEYLAANFSPSIWNEPVPAYPTPYYLATNNRSTLELSRKQVASARAILSRFKGKTVDDSARIKSASQFCKMAVVLRDVWQNIINAMEASRDYASDRRQIERALDAIAEGGPREYWYEAGVGENTTTETEVLSGRISRALRVDFTFEQIKPLWNILQSRLFYREADNANAEFSAIVWSRRAKLSGRGRVTAEQWTDGAKGSFYQDAPTLVRRVGDTLETSRGASCPFKHAVIAFKVAQHCRATGTVWQRNGKTIHVGAFQVDSIDAHGNMRAGCHTIAFDEMTRLACREIPAQVVPCFLLPAIIK